MRADRLISLLMLLQTRGRMTAQDLSRELEVSERTIYRDIEALGASGVPVFCESGPGGGCQLLDSYRTTLTGLTEDEARALFALSVPAPLAKLGMSQTLKAALLKLSAALPARQRSDEEKTRQRLHLDSAGWFQADEPVPHLRMIHEAVWNDRQLHLTRLVPYAPLPGTQVESVVEPYGLVAKANVWYLVCRLDEHWAVHRVSHILEARLLEASFARQPEFDLAAFWRDWCATYERMRAMYPVTLRVAPELMRHLPHYFGDRVRELSPSAGATDERGWTLLTLTFESLEEARRRILPAGGAVEVLEPLALRLSVADFARQTAGVYGSET